MLCLVLSPQVGGEPRYTPLKTDFFVKELRTVVRNLLHPRSPQWPLGTFPTRRSLSPLGLSFTF